MDRIFADFKEIILPGISHWQHPGWNAYFPANNSPESILGEMLSAGLGTMGMSWQVSPRWRNWRIWSWNGSGGCWACPRGFSGVIQDTASTGTLSALLTARERATNYDSNDKGLRQPLIVYATRETHSSLEKGIKISGYGRENLRMIETDENFAMISGKLERRFSATGPPGFSRRSSSPPWERRPRRPWIRSGDRRNRRPIRPLAPCRRGVRRDGRRLSGKPLDARRRRNTWIRSSSTPTNGC